MKKYLNFRKCTEKNNSSDYWINIPIILKIRKAKMSVFFMFSYYPGVLVSVKFVFIDLFVTCWSVRSTHQLLVTDSGSVCSLERAAWTTRAQRDQQETTGEKQRRTAIIFLLKYLVPCVCVFCGLILPLFLSPVGVGAERCFTLVEGLETAALGGCERCSRAIHQVWRKEGQYFLCLLHAVRWEEGWFLFCFFNLGPVEVKSNNDGLFSL